MPVRYYRVLLFRVALVVAMLLLVPLLRMYVGVHYSTDLFGCHTLGLGLLGIWRLEAVIEFRLVRRTHFWKLLLILALPVLAILSTGYGEDAYLVLGASTGLIFGLVLERRWLLYDYTGTLGQQILRFILRAAQRGCYSSVEGNPIEHPAPTAGSFRV